MLIGSLPDAGYPGSSALQLSTLKKGDVAPDRGLGLDGVLAELEGIVHHAVPLWHPSTAAHLHCPVLMPALAAELVISSLNQSMDSFDQAPAATVIEQDVVSWLCRLVGLPSTSTGTFTAGGTQSNYMGMLLARDRFVERRWRWNAHRQGLPSDAARMRILCSEAAHFSVEKSAIQLGLGTDAVVKIPVDSQFRMRPDALASQVAALRDQGLEPTTVVATAGTTDFGSFDPLPAIADLASREQLWLHVDAAYGGAFLLSDSHRHRLAGLERADSVTIDFHKAFFQPISCGAFLLADAGHFRFIRLHSDYLNPEAHERDAIPDLVTQSVMTTRRFDALKLWMSLRTFGRQGFAEMIDRLVELAAHVAGRVDEHPRLTGLHQPAFGCVVFRYVPADAARDADALNAAIPRTLFRRGLGVVGQTVVHGRPALKLTLSNPCTEPDELDGLIRAMVAVGDELERVVISHLS